LQSKLIRDHQTELQLARALAVKFLVTGTHVWTLYLYICRH